MQNTPAALPDDFEELRDAIVAEAESLEGFLSGKEMRFLALMAAYPTATGGIVEIGSFKGKSALVLAKAAGLADGEKVHAVDPMTAPSETDPDLRGDASSLADFERNIREHGVGERVELHQDFSFNVATDWSSPLRLLWIDGDHTYAGTKLDLDGFRPFLEDKAIVAIHDVLHEFEGGVRVFAEDILLSPNFGACGLCGSIAWAQYRVEAGDTIAFRSQKLALYKKLVRLVSFVAFDKRLSAWDKKKYKFWRALVPHGEVDPAIWTRLVNSDGPN